MSQRLSEAEQKLLTQVRLFSNIHLVDNPANGSLESFQAAEDRFVLGLKGQFDGKHGIAPELSDARAVYTDLVFEHSWDEHDFVSEGRRHGLAETFVSTFERKVNAVLESKPGNILGLAYPSIGDFGTSAQPA